MSTNLTTNHTITQELYATGKRKTSIARVFIKKGNGSFLINNKNYDVYFSRAPHKLLIKQPFKITNSTDTYDVRCFVTGGGHSGQAGAVKHGISKILAGVNESIHAILRNIGFLTRDDRRVERKKYGQPKARKKFQFSKR
jgi:small subunit ribosomal protein S9